MKTIEIVKNTTQVDKIEEIQDRINSLTDDLKAEVIISEIINKLNDEKENFLIEPLGQFKRPFRKDILNAEIIDFNYDDTQFLKINLSRDGIYDTLPEGIFHAPRTDKIKKSVDEMTKEYKTNKKEEEFARKFFLPFENEFFLHGLKKENLEKKFLLELNGDKPIEFFYDFWGLDKEIPEILISKLIRILPYAYKIVGNLDLTAHCLSYLLKEDVQMVEEYHKELSYSENIISLGNCRLGLDMISGDAYTDYSLYLEFQIGPLKKSSFLEYIHDGKLKKFLNLFYEYFMPMEVDVKTTIILEKELELFEFKETTILGITTRI